jgi:hypothetical protein
MPLAWPLQNKAQGNISQQIERQKNEEIPLSRDLGAPARRMRRRFSAHLEPEQL